MKTIKLSQYGIVISPDKVNAIHEEMRAGVGEPITLDFKDVKGIDSAAAHELLKSMRGHKGALVQMKNASPMVKSVMMYSSGATGSVKAGVSASAGRGRKPRFSFFRIFAMITLLLTLACGNAKAWYVKAYGPGWGGWDSRNIGTGEYTWYNVSAGTFYYHLGSTESNWSGDDLVQNKSTMADHPSIKSSAMGLTDGQMTITLPENSNVTIKYAGSGSDWKVNVYVRPAYYIKYNWYSGGWNWSDHLYSNGDGTYSTGGGYRSSGATSYDYNSKASDDGKTNSTNITVLGSPSNGAECIFTYKPSDHSLTIQKKNTTGGTNHIYFDNTEAGWSDSKIQFVMGHLSYSRTFVMSKVGSLDQTNLYYVARSGNDWTDAAYFGMIGSSSKFIDGEWGSRNMMDATHYSAPLYKNLNLLNNCNYIVTKADDSNGGAIEVTQRGSSTGYSQMNYLNVGFKYALSTDGGESYSDMSSGKTPGQVDMGWFQFNNYGSVTSKTAKSKSAGAGSPFYQVASSAGYRTKTTLTESNTVDGYEFVGWYEGSTLKSTANPYSYYPNANCTITARFKTVLVTSITLDKTSTTLTAGGATETLTATVLPSNALDKAVTWTTSNSSVATVSSSGVVNPVAAGTCTITATAHDGSGKTATCSVTVEAGVPTHTLTWDLDGGTATGGTAAGSVAEGATLTAPTVTKVGYNFAGWSPTVPATMPSSDATYRATWTKVYASGTYNFQSGVTMGSSPNQKTITSSDVLYSAFRVDNLFFSESKCAYDDGSTSSTGIGSNYNGWKIKTSGATIKFFVENNSSVSISIGNLGSASGKEPQVTYTSSETNGSITATFSAGETKDCPVKAGTMVTISTRDEKTVTLQKIVISAAASCSATQPGTISKGTASGGTGTITLTAAGSPATNNTWYWQSTADGTSTSESGATKNVSAAGTYHIRSYCSNGAGCWSDARSVTVVAADLLTPISPTLSYASTVNVDGTINPSLSGNTGSGSVTYSLNSVTPAGSLTINSSTGDVTGVTAGGTATVTATIAANGNYAGNTATSGTITVTAAATCSGDPTALVSGTLYMVEDMASACASALNATGQFKYGLSDNGKFYVVGTTNDNNESTGTVEMKTDVSLTDIGGDTDADFTNSAWLKMAGGTSHHSIKFVIPTGGGTLTVYGKGGGSNKGNVQIKESSTGTVTEVIANSSSSACKSSAISVNAGTYYIYSSGASAALYGIKFVETPAATLYTVTFNSNGGSAVSPATQASAGASIAKPSDPTRASYEFDGWYTTAGEKISWPYTPTADITLYARWEEECDAEGVAKSTTDVAATGYTAYQEKGGANVVFTSAPSLGFKYKDADGNIVNNSTTAVVRNNAYSCQIKSDSGNKGSIKTNSTFSNVDSISFYFAASDKSGCKIAVWYSTDNFSTDSTSLLSATTYGDSNSEFKRKTLAIPVAKKASLLTFKFRFTVTGAGKICYMDSLKVYSSTTGGSTCYHVYYHGNGAESGYVNDTVSYTAGSKATVLNYNYGRYPLAKAGNDFQGWATSADGAVVYTAGQKIDITSADVDLYAVWAAESDALVTWKMQTANDEAWATTTGTGTTDGTNISSIGTSHDEGDNKAKNSATAKTAMAAAEVSGTAAPSNSANFTFTIGATKQVEINKFDCKVFNVASGSRTYKAQISDEAGNVYNSTNTVAVSAEATLTDASFVFGSTKILRGDVTIRIYAWGSGSEFRMGPDVKFYGTVENYICATPSAPTISGVSEYVPGQTITLTASHDGENHDNLTTYTWYKGVDWATASGTTPVQDAATGEDGYIFTKATCAAGDAGKYWCKVSNGTGCDAHNSEGYNIIVYPTYTITYNLNGGAWGEVVHKDSYTQFDEDYTLPVPTKADAIFAGWYGKSDFSGLPTVVLGAGSVGNKEYWAKWGASVTVSWTVTKVDSKLYRGGGDYSVTAVIDQTTWNESYKDQLELTATEGVTLKNIVASVNGESKVQVTADFDITTDLAADATSITFTLNVPADGTYGPKVDEHEEDLTDCGGGASGYTEFFSMIPKAKTCSITNTEAYNASNHYTTCECTSSATITSGGSVTFGLYSSGTGTTDKFWEYNSKNGGWKHSIANSWVVLYSTDQFKAGDSIVITNGNTSSSGYYTIVAAASNNTADYHSASQVAAPSTTSPAKNTNYYYKLPVSFVSSNYLVIRSSTSSSCYVGTIKAYHAAAKGGETPTLTWDDGDDDIATSGVSKNTSDNDFIYTARQDKNSLGAITYSSGDATVATVNATTGQVHLVGAAGTATITATIAASGCFSSASVSYTITVTDDCDDEAGTITTEDLGCSGIKMTVTGHTTTGEKVSYQWYKDDVSLGSADGAQTATYTTTAAGEYYVIVTNSGDRHCAKRSTNTITVEAQAAATVAKIVDSWYVKKDRRTPDIELVKTTNATSFTVTNGSTVIWNSDGSNTTGFAGCGFRMDENGIIYLNGTKDGSSGTSDNADAPAHGDETWTAGDVTLTITAIGCGSNASQNITIHKQAATSYYDIAFVADGGKGMKKDSITVGHGDGTELYEYLDSVGTAAGKRLFQLSERNIYWTTDEKAIREEYSQFDAILITDDPSTNTVVKTGDDYKTKGYVNAFGTMVDVRPIFTMEAYVSALKNWGSKGIKGSPESPNPRQYEMRLECKDHEIYGAGLPDPEDGTNVWEEVIDGETFRHVIIVDSTKGVYKGVAYNAQTAGKEKPALQGFTGDAAGSLLGLGRISNGSLQAAIERQEEPAARLLVMGINAKALQPTCALTNEGKAVIKNILFYLLKTNMEEVDDCSNYFTGGASGTDTDWNKASNWSKNALPSNEAKVRILAPCVVKNGNTFHVAQVDIATSGPSSKKGSGAANGNLTIEAGGALIVAGKIRAAEAPYFAANDLKPTTPENLIIKTGSTAQAALIFDNEEGETQATVNYYSLGRKDGSAYQFQYFASPMGYLEINPAFAGAGIYTYAWDETIQDGWERRGYYTDVLGFEGLAITTKFVEDYHYYTLKGALASTADIDIALTYTDAGAQGQNLIGNSWTAPINIASLVEAFEDDANVTKTVNIYNSGNDEHQVGTAGTWTSVPIDISGWDAWTGLKVIPAMQAYRIDVTGETQLSLNYKTMVRQTPSDKLNEPLKAPTRRSNDNGASLMRLRMESGMAYTDLFLVEGDRFSEAFDNGYEAKFIAGEDNTVQFYAMNGEEKMAVLATDALEGTPVGFVPGKGTAYTISFSGDGMGYYLNDVKKQTSTLISEENTYSFDYEAGDDANRFYISATPFSMPQITTGMENLDAVAPKVQKVVYNDKMYIIRGGKVFSADGQLVK